MNALHEEILEGIGRTGFSGVISFQLDGSSFSGASGFSDRANGIENRLSTRFGTSSGTKGFTAVGIARLIQQKRVGFDTPAIRLLGDVLGNLDPDITIAHLLGHTSGMGDYLDEESIQDINHIVLAVPVQNLVSPLDYAPLMNATNQQSPPGARFRYSNSGYVALAMIIEIVGGQPYQDFIQEQVFDMAGMTGSGFFRSDQLPADTAIGYIPDDSRWRSNVFHIPVRGGGDGGAYSTIEDMRKFWHCLKSSQLVDRDLVAGLFLPRQETGEEGLKYGYGFWIDGASRQIILEGYDAGVSFRSATAMNGCDGYTVISNTSSGVWPLVRILTRYFQQGSPIS